MPDPAKEFLDNANRRFYAVLEAQSRVAQLEGELDKARAARDVAIRDATDFGFPRRALAQATNLTPGRVQQIVDQAAAQERPHIEPALRMDRERRRRSLQLADLARENTELPTH